MNRILSFLILVLAGSIAVAARGPSKQNLNRDVLRAIAEAPFRARTRQNPYQQRPDAVLAGEKLFRHHCAQCHGTDGSGVGRAASLRSPAVQNATPGELEWFLRNGNLRAGMPSWSGLPEQRRWQIVAYLKTLRE
ncbi:MAG TPA: c-type cytochrome [Candidatus Acidoferrales bacterium]|nr:c-type cytochrome [Candidatus Acidoferrales bacterium]